MYLHRVVIEMTEKLYDLDSYVVEFDCKVVNLYNIDDERLAVETDRTAFFPTGGGQTCDSGYLSDIRVDSVEIEHETILHIVENCEENVKKLQVGTVLHGVVDWNKRFSDMQQHSGEHLFSGVVHSLFGYNNVGFHLSQNEVTMDFDGILEYNDLCKVEDLVNKAIWDNIEIKVSYPDEKDLTSIEYRSKKEIDGPLRIVEIPGVDVCACCAPHVRRTGEIGSLRVIAFEKHRGGTRIYILCGERNLLDSREKLLQNRLVSNMLSAKQNETAEFVQKLKDDNSKLQFELSGLKKELLKLKASAVCRQKRIVEFADADGETLIEYADLLSEKAEEFAAVFSDSDAKRFVIITKTDFDVSSLCREMNAALHSKGGGRGGIVQGSVNADKETIEQFLLNY